MGLLFLQNSLSSYKLSSIENLPLFTRSKEDPSFCLLPKFLTLKKAKKLKNLQSSYPFLVWIFPTKKLNSYLVRPKLLKALQPLYFLSGSIIYDQRYLKTEKALYKLPPVQIDICRLLHKTEQLQSEENEFFYPERSIPFYFKGDTTDRIQLPSYSKALSFRKTAPQESLLSFIYFFLKKKLDV